MKTIRPGVSATLVYKVRTEDGAARWGNELPVLATPVLLWLGEITSMKAIESILEEGEMSVGYGHNSLHLAATPVGWEVRVTATLTRIDGKMLHFEVEARDEQDVVFTGQHVRAVLNRVRFAAKLDAKTSGVAVKS